MADIKLRDIPGYEGIYAVTPDGRVWSYPKKHWRKGRGIWLKQSNKKGYMGVVLCREHPVKKLTTRRDMRVHRLVAMAYIKTNSFKRQVNHKDGNKLNNHYTNLEWSTPAQNTWHAANVTGVRKVRGADNGNAKLTMEDVRQIRQLYAGNVKPVYKIAEQFGVHRCTVSVITHNKSWRQLEPVAA